MAATGQSAAATPAGPAPVAGSGGSGPSGGDALLASSEPTAQPRPALDDTPETPAQVEPALDEMSEQAEAAVTSDQGVAALPPIPEAEAPASVREHAVPLALPTHPARPRPTTPPEVVGSARPTPTKGVGASAEQVAGGEGRRRKPGLWHKMKAGVRDVLS